MSVAHGRQHGLLGIGHANACEVPTHGAARRGVLSAHVQRGTCKGVAGGLEELGVRVGVLREADACGHIHVNVILVLAVVVAIKHVPTCIAAVRWTGCNQMQPWMAL